MQDSVIYVLYSGDMYGTEQMALAHAQVLAQEASTLILAPSGPVHEAAAALGLQTRLVSSKGEIFREMLKIARQSRTLSFLTTSVTQALIGLAVAGLCPATRIRHLNICHGGEQPERSFGKKKWLNWTPVRMVAVSSYCARLLQQFGVAARRIVVLENFLTDARIAQAPRRTTDAESPILQALVACRLVPVKRVHLLVSAFKLEPLLAERMRVRILGAGPLLEELRQLSEGLGFQFDGYRRDIADVMGQSDLFVQTWDSEPFGLAAVEAMAAGLIVVTPDRGGTAEVVGNDQCGVFYAAGDPRSLAQALLKVADMPQGSRAAMRDAAAARAMACYSASSRRERLMQVFLGAQPAKHPAADESEKGAHEPKQAQNCSARNTAISGRR